MKVMKFGGTSVGKPERMHGVAQLITRDEEPTIVVLSALSGTTNFLVLISHGLASNDRNDAKNKIDNLEAHYQQFINDRRELFVILHPQIVTGDGAGSAAMQEFRAKFTVVGEMFEEAGL